MNPIFISTIIGVGSFILTIFSSIYLNHRHVDKLMERMDKQFEARIDALRFELKAEIGALRFELKAEIGALRFELKAEMVEIKTGITAEIAEVRAEQRATNRILEYLEARFKLVAAD